MRVPDDLLNDLAAHKIHGRGRTGSKKSKFDAAVTAAAQSPSVVSSPDSVRRHRIADGKLIFYFSIIDQSIKLIHCNSKSVKKSITACMRVK